jgi:hypothetical protein
VQTESKFPDTSSDFAISERAPILPGLKTEKLRIAIAIYRIVEDFV